MRILFVISYYKPAYIYGGPVRSVSTLAEQLTALRQDVTVFTTNANGEHNLPVPTDRPTLVDGVPVHYFARSRVSPSRFYLSPDLWRACHRHAREYDILYITATWTFPFIAATRTAAKHNVPYVVAPRGSFMDWTMRAKWLKKRLYMQVIERRAMQHAAAIHCTSELEQAHIRQWRFQAPTRLIPNGLDLEPYQRLPARGALRRQLGIAQDAPVTLYVGRLHHLKRIQRMVEAFSTVAQSIPDAHLVLIGPDEDGSGEVARSWAATHGLANRVHLPGIFTGAELLQAYTDADMLVLLSHSENFGMVVVEAMAAGLPVLLSQQVGIGSYVADAGAGLVVDAESPQTEAAWIELITSPRRRSAMSAAAKTLVSRHFSSPAVAQQLLDVFQQITSVTH